MLNFLLVDNLMDKYGEGSTQIHKCQTCEYEKKIYSGGTHISEGGSLMVYAEEDEFVCPNCDPSAVDGNDSDAGKSKYNNNIFYSIAPLLVHRIYN